MSKNNNSDRVSPIERLIMEKESEKVGGIVSQILGEQGAKKTMALVNKASIDFNQDRVIFWRGQSSCQWILLCANYLPVTLWMHESFEDFSFEKSGSKRKGIASEEIDPTEMSDIDVEIRHFSSPEELVDKAEIDRVNVYFLPERDNPQASKREREKVFYQKMHVKLFSALNNRDWMDHVSILNDENDNVFSSDTMGELYYIQEFELPSEVEDFRKNKISHMGATHSYQSVHYKYHDVKANDRVYMRRAKVHKQDQQINQSSVNSFERGQFIIPGFDKDKFEMPYLPHETISWMPEKDEVKLRMTYTASIPDLRPDNKDVDRWIDDKPFDKKHLEDLIDVEIVAQEMDVAKRSARRKMKRGDLPSIKAEGKWLTSMTALVNSEEVPK